MTRVRVGVLALQGDVREHAEMLSTLGADVELVRSLAGLDTVDGLVIPGGESSVIDKLSRIFGIRDAVIARIAQGMPVYGTCAGLIMLADRVLDGAPGQQSFGGLDVAVRRNAFGSQLDSFETALDVDGFEDAVHATFIRAPIVETVGERARAIARLDGGRVVAVEQGGILATSFHPEMNGEPRFHERFLANVAAQ